MYSILLLQWIYRVLNIITSLNCIAYFIELLVVSEYHWYFPSSTQLAKYTSYTCTETHTYLFSFASHLSDIHCINPSPQLSLSHIPFTIAQMMTIIRY